MKILLGKSLRKSLPNNTYLDVSYYSQKWTTVVNMSLWEEGNGSALKFEDRTYFNFEIFLPDELARKITKYLINKQSQRVAEIDLI